MVERSSSTAQGLVSQLLAASEREDEFAGGVVVRHHDVHVPEFLLATQLGRLLDRAQIQRGAGLADPVLSACIIETDYGMVCLSGTRTLLESILPFVLQ